MRNYLLLLYSKDDGFQDVSPEEMQRVIEEYKAWGDRLREEGRFLASDKLKDREGRVLRGGDGQLRILDGPYSETKEIVGGYYAIRAADYDEAVKVCEGCPHLTYGGMIELREIDELH